MAFGPFPSPRRAYTSILQVLVLAPAIVVRNWEAECTNFLRDDLLDRMNVRVFDAGLVSACSNSRLHPLACTGLDELCDSFPECVTRGALARAFQSLGVFPYTQVSFHKLHKSTGYPKVQVRVWEWERMGELGKNWLRGAHGVGGVFEGTPAS
jgi:hypothetical protein